MTTASEPIGLPRPQILGPLILLVSLDVFAIVIFHEPWYSPPLVTVVAAAWIVAQTALYGVWVSIAPVSLRWRLASVPVAVVALFVMLFEAFLVAQGAITVVLMWCLLISGFRLVQVDEHEVPVWESAPWQFDLKRLLLLMTGTCVGLAIAAAARIPASALLGSLIAGAVLALFTFPAVPALLAARQANVWGGLIMGLGLWFGLFLEGMTHSSGLAFTFVFVMLASEMVALLYVRRCGYRLRRATG